MLRTLWFGLSSRAAGGARLRRSDLLLMSFAGEMLISYLTCGRLASKIIMYFYTHLARSHGCELQIDESLDMIDDARCIHIKVVQYSTTTPATAPWEEDDLILRNLVWPFFASRVLGSDVQTFCS
jgi:hypothetical protein